jgi:molybdopterin-guanine dinucleotide biosynthesis protein A
MIDVALAILAGGEGSRMGFPKGEMRPGGRPILPLLLERFDWPGPTLLVTAPGREHPTGWELFSRECVDPQPGQGPLRGLLTALENTPVPHVVVTAVDMPGIGRPQLEWVGRELRTWPGVVGIMLREGHGAAGRVQPFPSAFRIQAAPLVRRMLETNHRSLHGLLDDASILALDAPAEWGEEVWTNVNTPEDLGALEE